MKFAFIIVIVLTISSLFISFFKRYKVNLKHNEGGANFSDEVIFDDIRVHINNDSFSHDSLKEETHNNEVAAYLKKNLNRGDTIIDIAHNTGMQTLLMAKLIQQPGRIYFYNPSKRYVDSVKSSALTNGFESRIFPHALGISDCSFDGLLVYKNNFPNITGKIKPKNHKIPVGYSAITVEVSSIDEQLPNLQNVNLIIIDINDDCSKIINGATNLIKKSKELSIIINYNDAFSVDSSAFQTLLDAGFGVNIIQSDGSLQPSNVNEIKKLNKCFLLFMRR
jgi:FkbM family methyltransferase